MRIVFNTLEGNYALCLLANLIHLAYIHREDVLKDVAFPTFTVSNNTAFRFAIPFEGIKLLLHWLIKVSLSCWIRFSGNIFIKFIPFGQFLH